MGLIFTDIELLNAGDMYNFRRKQIAQEQVRSVKVNALVDSGAYMLTINQKVAQELGADEIDENTAILADGSKIRVPVVGPIEVRFQNRRTTVDAVVVPGDDTTVLLGAIPMEGMDVVIDYANNRMTVHPDHPNIAVTILK